MKSKIKSYILPDIHMLMISIIFSFSGCGGVSWVNDRLDQAEILMEYRADSALSILDSIHPAILNGNSQTARYALLKSIALDKNYIDKTSFEVLQPAIDYYLDNGTPDEKLRTYYYQGRIFYNRNDRDRALYSLMKGLDLMQYCKDSLTIVRALVMQAILDQSFYDYAGYTDNYMLAAKIYGNKDLKWQEFDCLLNGLNGNVILRRKEVADSLLMILSKFEIRDSIQMQRLNSHRLAYTYSFGSDQELKNLVDTITVSMDYDISGILNLARAYHRLGDNDKAMRQLEYLDEFRIPYDTLKYLSIKFAIFESLGKYEYAFNTYKDFSNRLETINSAKFAQKSKSMEEKHQMELQAERTAQKHARTIWSFIGGFIVLVMIIAMMLLVIRNDKVQKRLALQKAQMAELENDNLKAERERLSLENRNLQLERDNKALEAENLAHRVDQLESESENLKNLLESQEEMPAEVRKAIQTRIEMLNSYLASQIADNRDFEKAYDTWVEQLTANTEEFMDSNRLAFQASHPNFIKYFEDHDLTTAEINYVCLYAIGLRGKEVGSYMKKRSHVNLSSAIRKKLGIDKHETNIGIYVRKLLKSL